MKYLVYFLIIFLFYSCSQSNRGDNISFSQIDSSTNSLYGFLSDREKIPLNTVEKSFFLKNICSTNDPMETEIQNLEDGIFKAGIASPHSAPLIFSIRNDSIYILDSYEEEYIFFFLKEYATGSAKEERLDCFVNTLLEIKNNIQIIKSLETVIQDSELDFKYD